MEVFATRRRVERPLFALVRVRRTVLKICVDEVTAVSSSVSGAVLRLWTFSRESDDDFGWSSWRWSSTGLHRRVGGCGARRSPDNLAASVFCVCSWPVSAGVVVMRSAVVFLWATGCLQLLGPRPVFAKKLVDIFWNVTNPM